ncbi:hypothetical protein KFK09_010979 [Dendrobium nobile]|uniref:Uncharacterized protein n=1 Tax=Dendrobium nobile TaxID=94219 RepID=A0A8T3BH30_DENNO|nr:hypothetical protein KFK09_010979 [Dendrobium nobile]
MKTGTKIINFDVEAVQEIFFGTGYPFDSTLLWRCLAYVPTSNQHQRWST